jgi:hypothetical protein
MFGIKGISGGERRRLAFASEVNPLIINPIKQIIEIKLKKKR